MTTMSRMMAFLMCLAVGCAPNPKAQVSIEYRQLANFHQYYISNETTAKNIPEGKVQVLYVITSIQNIGGDAQPFNFDRHELSTVSGDGILGQDLNDILNNQLVPGISQLLVKPGETKSADWHQGGLGCVVIAALDKNAKVGVDTQIELRYRGIGEKQPVSSIRVPGNTSIAYVIDAKPSVLNKLCKPSP